MLNPAYNHTAGMSASTSNHTAGMSASTSNHAAGMSAPASNHTAGISISVHTYAADILIPHTSLPGMLIPAYYHTSDMLIPHTPLQVSATAMQTSTTDLHFSASDSDQHIAAFFHLHHIKIHMFQRNPFCKEAFRQFRGITFPDTFFLHLWVHIKEHTEVIIS